LLLGLCAACVLFPSSAQALGTAGLRAKLTREARRLGPAAGLYVRDLGTGRTLFSRNQDTALAPASNEKLLVTATALLTLGPDAVFHTAVLAPSQPVDGAIDGDVVLTGGGDPYLRADQVRDLASQIAALGVVHIRGRVLADASLLDTSVGSYRSAWAFDGDIGGRLAALVVDHGRGKDPVLHAAQILHDALKDAGVELDGKPQAGRAPEGAVQLAGVDSAPLRSVIAAINVPSDNFAAELLLKDLGARSGEGGSTAAGAAVVRATLASFGIHPRVLDGSGLARADRVTPRQLVRLLERMAAQPVGDAFAASLPVAGRTGTLRKRMRGTPARDRCRAKTGTLIGVSALSGYCTTTGGANLAFSFLENRVCEACAKRVEDRMTVALATYSGSAPSSSPSSSGGAPSSSASSPASSSTATPRRSAFSSFEPGDSPATR
jgi:D-alanyl-D-alanine carboxypeptidase/D-alanyl-D-alanine-endopeptidase (penicillin-binding protein 4)